MARSRKQKERKLRGQLHALQVRHAAVKDRIKQDDANLATYIGGVTQFGLGVLHMIEVHSAAARFDHSIATAIIQAASDKGLIEWHKPSKSWRMTHHIKEQFSETGLQTDSEGASEAVSGGDDQTGRQTAVFDGPQESLEHREVEDGLLPVG